MIVQIPEGCEFRCRSLRERQIRVRISSIKKIMVKKRKEWLMLDEQLSFLKAELNNCQNYQRLQDGRILQ